MDFDHVSFEEEMCLKQAEIQSKQKETANLMKELFRNINENTASVTTEINKLKQTIARKDVIVKKFQNDWRNVKAGKDKAEALLKEAKDKMETLLKDNKNKTDANNVETVENKETTEMEELIAANDQLMADKDKLIADKLSLKKKLKAKNLKIHHLKIALRDYVEGEYRDDDRFKIDEANEVDEVDEADIGEYGDDDGTDAVFVDVDTDRDVVMDDKADEAVDVDEVKDEEPEVIKTPGGSAKVDVDKLLSEEDTDPDEESFEVNAELLKAELEDEEKDKKYAAKEAKKKLKRAKKKKKKTKKTRRSSKAASNELVINEEEL